MRRTILLVASMILTLLVASGVALAMAIGSAQAANKVVGPGESIQKAVNAADPGDTIIVRGVHREDVIITKNGIKLRGEGDAVIEAPARAGSPCSKFGGVLVAICVVGDFNPEPAEVGILDGGASRNTKIVNNVVRGYDLGIEVGENTNTTIAGNDSIGNRLGVLLIDSTGTKMLSNDITDTTEVGTVILDSTGTKKVSNDISHYGDAGISIFGPKP